MDDFFFLRSFHTFLEVLEKLATPNRSFKFDAGGGKSIGRLPT